MGSGHASDARGVGWAKDASARERPCPPERLFVGSWWARALRALSPPYRATEPVARSAAAMLLACISEVRINPKLCQHPSSVFTKIASILLRRKENLSRHLNPKRPSLSNLLGQRL